MPKEIYYMHKTKKAFSLVEMIIAIVIVAVLASVSYVSYVGLKKGAKDKKLDHDVKTLNTMLGIVEGRIGKKDLNKINNIDTAIIALKQVSDINQKSGNVIFLNFSDRLVDPKLDCTKNTSGKNVNAATFDASKRRFIIIKTSDTNACISFNNKGKAPNQNKFASNQKMVQESGYVGKYQSSITPELTASKKSKESTLNLESPDENEFYKLNQTNSKNSLLPPKVILKRKGKEIASNDKNGILTNSINKSLRIDQWPDEVIVIDPNGASISQILYFKDNKKWVKETIIEKNSAKLIKESAIQNFVVKTSSNQKDSDKKINDSSVVVVNITPSIQSIPPPIHEFVSDDFFEDDLEDIVEVTIKHNPVKSSNGVLSSDFKDYLDLWVKSSDSAVWKKYPSKEVQTLEPTIQFFRKQATNGLDVIACYRPKPEYEKFLNYNKCDYFIIKQRLRPPLGKIKYISTYALDGSSYTQDKADAGEDFKKVYTVEVERGNSKGVANESMSFILGEDDSQKFNLNKAFSTQDATRYSNNPVHVGQKPVIKSKATPKEKYKHRYVESWNDGIGTATFLGQDVLDYTYYVVDYSRSMFYDETHRKPNKIGRAHV